MLWHSLFVHKSPRAENGMVSQWGWETKHMERISPLIQGRVLWKIRIRPEQASSVTRSNINVLTQHSTGLVCTIGKSQFCRALPGRAEHSWPQAGPVRCPSPPRWLCSAGRGFKVCGAPVLQHVGIVRQHEYAWTFQTFLQSHPILVHKGAFPGR